MQNKTLKLIVVSQDDRFSTCVQYVFDLFCRVYGYDCHYTMQGQEPAPTAGDVDIVIHYSESAGHWDANPTSPTVTIQRGSFFGDGFGKSITPPEDLDETCAVSKATAFSSLARRTGMSAVISHDFIAAAFYLLSGYHDWTSTARDAHGRVLSSDVPLTAETWDIPHVNHWFRQLDELVRSLHRRETDNRTPAVAPSATHTICLTHDVDLLRKYRPAAVARHLARTAKTSPGQLLKESKRAARVLGGRERDPYDSFDQLYTVKERISAQSTFFFMGSNPGGRNGDYRVGGHDARNLMTRARSFGDEIAVHGSWESADSADAIREEKLEVEKAARVSTQGNRQHYLRFSNPGTWNSLAAAGIRYDSTGGFPDRCGFKYGWSGCFYPFDLDRMRQLPILEIPLVCMDVTLAAYEKIPAELALERLSTLLDNACDNVPGGAFVFLWHNTMGDRVAYPGYFDTFEYFFSVASGSARYITLAQLCDEFESTR